MDLNSLIHAYQHASNKLDNAIQSQDQVEIQRMDSCTSRAFDEIFSLDVTSRDERADLENFLLGVMAPEEKRTPLEQRIVEKITSLVVG